MQTRQFSSKIEIVFEKGNRANRAAPGIEKDRKIFDHLLCGASNAELCFSTTILPND